MCKEDQRIKKEKVSIRHYICKAVGCMLHLWVLRPDIMYATSKTSRKKKSNTPHMKIEWSLIKIIQAFEWKIINNYGIKYNKNILM